ncbi:MAG TPA: hypothetical protein V6D08_00315, partial [Candidatus Obscuribacterales bacterium]
ALQRRVVELLEQQDAVDRNALAAELVKLGQILKLQCDFQEAELCLEKALQLLAQVREGRDEKCLSLAALELVPVYLAAKQFKEAEAVIGQLATATHLGARDLDYALNRLYELAKQWKAGKAEEQSEDAASFYSALTKCISVFEEVMGANLKRKREDLQRRSEELKNPTPEFIRQAKERQKQWAEEDTAREKGNHLSGSTYFPSQPRAGWSDGGGALACRRSSRPSNLEGGADDRAS